jgi:hypothetical protein
MERAAGLLQRQWARLRRRPSKPLGGGVDFLKYPVVGEGFP